MGYKLLSFSLLIVVMVDLSGKNVLLVLSSIFKNEKRLQCCKRFGGENEIRTRGTLIRFVGLANRWFQPLTHLSKMVAPTRLELVYPA